MLCGGLKALSRQQSRGLESPWRAKDGTKQDTCLADRRHSAYGAIGCCAQSRAVEGPSALQVEANERNVDTVRSDVQLMLWPIGILLAVLTLGGLLSVVFGIRDQRRVTQLHELAVSGETYPFRGSRGRGGGSGGETQRSVPGVREVALLGGVVLDIERCRELAAGAHEA
jgi:hypothetical protein